MLHIFYQHANDPAHLAARLRVDGMHRGNVACGVLGSGNAVVTTWRPWARARLERMDAIGFTLDIVSE
jgi:hypothetical protein